MLNAVKHLALTFLAVKYSARCASYFLTLRPEPCALTMAKHRVPCTVHRAPCTRSLLARASARAKLLEARTDVRASDV